MGDKLVPEVEREVFVGAAEPGNKMVFECANGSFGGVSSVDMWWHELEGDLLIMEELFENFGGFVIEALQEWSEAFGDKFLVESFVSAENFLGCLVAERFG